MNGVCPFAAPKQPDAKPKTDHQLTATCPAGFGRKGTAGICPAGFGGGAKAASMASFSGLPRMPLTVLAGHQRGDARLVSVKGVVFDVSNDATFGRGQELARMAGHDISRIIAVCGTKAEGAGVDIGGDADDVDAGLEGLKYEEHQQLESYFVEMVQGRRAVAVLADEDYERIVGAPLGGNRQGVSFVRADDHDNAPICGSKEAQLHALVEQGDAEAVKELLRNARAEIATGKAEKKSLEPQEKEEQEGTVSLPPGQAAAEGSNVVVVDAPCPRTGLTPLLKAVEGSSTDVVRVLLQAGADVRRQAALYDGDDAIALATRLGSRDVIVEMLLASTH